MKKQGKGGILDCPYCETELDCVNQEFIGSEEMINRLNCPDCKREFNEVWSVQNWEEF